jgi:predicted chitinase
MLIEMGNGDEKKWWTIKIYWDRDCVQLTGRNNYKLFSDFIGEDCI